MTKVESLDLDFQTLDSIFSNCTVSHSSIRRREFCKSGIANGGVSYSPLSADCLQIFFFPTISTEKIHKDKKSTKFILSYSLTVELSICSVAGRV